MDYSLLARHELGPKELCDVEYDLFISSYNSSDRVNFVFNNVRAHRKIWLIHPEYQYEEGQLPSGGSEIYRPPGPISTPDFWFNFFHAHGLDRFSTATRVAIDITGMMRPHIMLLPLMFDRRGLETVDCIYSDPASYVAGNKTTFTKGSVTHVGQVEGYEGLHRSPGDDDLLVIGAGYDSALVQVVAEEKRTERHIVLFGLPSLQPHMYQESQSQVARSGPWLNRVATSSFLFAPANNPFMTAQVIHDYLSRLSLDGKTRNIYLSPVGSKSQALGFAWYFLCEAQDTATSLIFPFAPYYSKETSVGITRIGIFTLELDWISPSTVT